MARRYTPPNQKQKDAQRTKQLENRLYLCGLGEVNMTRESIKAAEIWLKKHLPDLKSVEVNYGDSPLKIRTITTTIKRAGE
jgi:hypothetical protein